MDLEEVAKLICEPIQILYNIYKEMCYIINYYYIKTGPQLYTLRLVGKPGLP